METAVAGESGDVAVADATPFRDHFAPESPQSGMMTAGNVNITTGLAGTHPPAQLALDDYLPPEMKFTLVNTIVIAIYANLFWISLVGNLIVFSRLLRKKKKSRVHILLINLCSADIMVTVVEMPLKVRVRIQSGPISTQNSTDFTA